MQAQQEMAARQQVQEALGSLQSMKQEHAAEVARLRQEASHLRAAAGAAATSAEADMEGWVLR